MNKRLAFLEATTQAGTADSFAWYALALEYRKEQRLDDAARAFVSLRAKDPGYLPLYLMAGQTLVEAGKPGEAAEWLEAGIVLARERGDSKTLGELESALADLA
ncbi:MAG TPA: tetratricopeptide repeat protein [Polyangiaceae bacterium]|nr:tetratricopeptide repeat protein [Polyangiaceae bacterium]